MQTQRLSVAGMSSGGCADSVDAGSKPALIHFTASGIAMKREGCLRGTTASTRFRS